VTETSENLLREWCFSFSLRDPELKDYFKGSFIEKEFQAP
jgi:hypothetical protein